MVDFKVPAPLLEVLPILPHALVAIPTIVQGLQYTKLAVTGRSPLQKLSPTILALLSFAEVILVGYFYVLPPFIGGEHAAPPATNWGAWLHFNFTGLQFIVLMLVSAWISEKKLWMFIGLLAYQASATIERIRSAFLGVERYVINRTSNPAFDAAHPLAGVPEWLDPVSSPLHTSPVTSYLDGSELQQAFWYFWSRWHTAIVADVALLVAAILVFSTLRNEPKSDADRSAKLTIAFFATFLVNAYSNSIPRIAEFCRQIPEYLIIPYITPDSQPLLYAYVRPRAALLALALGVQVRSMIISHIARGREVKVVKKGEKVGPNGQVGTEK